MKLRKQTLNLNVIDPSDDFSRAPEHRLWLAVIERFVTDFRELFFKVSEQIARSQTYNAHFFYDYKTLKHECEHQVFKDICEFANFSHDKVLDLFRQEARASGLFHYEPRTPKFSSSNVKRLRGWH